MSYSILKGPHLSRRQCSTSMFESEIRTVFLPTRVMAGTGSAPRTYWKRRGVAGLGDKDADGGIVPAVRFSDLKIEPRKIVDFAKYLGETRTVGAKRHQPIEADNSRRDSDEPTESAYVEEREVRQPQPQRPARACRRNLPTEQRVAQPAGNRNNHKDNIFGNTTSTCILRSAECTAFPAFVASRDVATLVLRIEAVRLFFFRVA